MSTKSCSARDKKVKGTADFRPELLCVLSRSRPSHREKILYHASFSFFAPAFARGNVKWGGENEMIRCCRSWAGKTKKTPRISLLSLIFPLLVRCCTKIG